MYFYDNHYTFSEFVKLGYAAIATKLFYPKATLIRRPVYLRGIPMIDFGSKLTTGYNCRIEAFGDRKCADKKIVFGDDCHIGDYVHIAAAERVEIGDECLFASRIFISDLDHGRYDEVPTSCPPILNPNDRELNTAPVSIGKKVWIGEGVCILKGVTVGDGCIIGANSVVTKNIPAGSIAAGVPARVIKVYNPETDSWESARK